jgi:hypothetical protein
MFRYVFTFKVMRVIVGVAWCVAIVRRLGEDIATVRDPPDPESRYVVISFWVVTAVIALLLATSGANSSE